METAHAESAPRSLWVRLRRALEQRPLLVLVVPACVAFAAVVWLGETARIRGVDDVVRHVDPFWLAVCLGGELLAYAGYVLALRDTARVDEGPRLSFRLSTTTVVAGFGVFAATRASGGFGVDYWALRRAGANRESAIARVLALGALEYVVLAPAAMFSALVLIASGDHRLSLGLTLPWLLVIPGALAAAWLAAPRRACRILSWRDGGRLRQGFAHAVSGLSIVRSLLTSPREYGLGLAGTAAYWVGDIACLWAALQVFGDPGLSLPALILAYATGYVLTRRSLPLGGAGIVEIALTFALHWVGVPLGRALVGVVIYRLFNLWLPILPALAVLPSIKRLRREFETA
jgi:uncharacterized membrane protein YbhN (UPF0104 family)